MLIVTRLLAAQTPEEEEIILLRFFLAIAIAIHLHPVNRFHLQPSIARWHQLLMMTFHTGRTTSTSSAEEGKALVDKYRLPLRFSSRSWTLEIEEVIEYSLFLC